MKKVLWMLVVAAFVGFGATQSVVAKEKGAHTPPVTVNGTVKVSGDDVTIVADDATYIVKSHNEKAVADLKAKDGQKVEVKGIVKEEDGKKELMLAPAGGGKGKGKKKGGDQ